MNKKASSYYWDSCVFIKAFQFGHPSYSMLRGYLDELNDSKIQIVTSSITYTEVYKNGGLKRMRRLRNLQIVDATSAITVRAANIRNKFKLKTPDAIHLATALYSGVEEFHTYDSGFFKPNLLNYYKGRLLVIKLR